MGLHTISFRFFISPNVPNIYKLLSSNLTKDLPSPSSQCGHSCSHAILAYSILIRFNEKPILRDKFSIYFNYPESGGNHRSEISLKLSEVPEIGFMDFRRNKPVRFRGFDIFDFGFEFGDLRGEVS